MKSYKATAIIILFCNVCLAQIQEKPSAYKKILFTYIEKPTIYIDSIGVYADSVLLKHIEIKNYTKIKLPQEVW